MNQCSKNFFYFWQLFRPNYTSWKVFSRNIYRNNKNTNEKYIWWIDSEEKRIRTDFLLFCSWRFAILFIAGHLTDRIVIVPLEILSLAFFLTVYTGFLISKTKFDFLVIFRILLIFLSGFIIYISLLLSNISQAIFFLFVPITLAVMLVLSFRASVVAAIFFLIISFFISDISAQLGMGLDRTFYAETPHILVIQEYIGHFVAVYFSFFILYYKHEFFKIHLRQQLLMLEKSENNDIILDETEDLDEIIEEDTSSDT